MVKATFQVIDGVDKGRVFKELPTPISIGREEGNTLRLNDERVSRFHAKVQHDQGDLVLTDLESTNGTKVNGNLVQIHRLRHGDCVCIGRSMLLYGSNEEIAARVAAMRLPGGNNGATAVAGHVGNQARATLMATAMEVGEREEDLSFNVKDEVRLTSDGLYIGAKEFPPLPQSLTPSQAARLAEILDFLHRAMSQTTEKVRSNSESGQVVLDYATWQKILAIEMLLARYHRSITEPDSWEV